MDRSRERGLTLLELLITMLVIAMVAAVTYPALSRGSKTLHLRAASRDVLRIFRYAREKAVTEQIGMRITVDRQKQELILSDSLGDDSRRYTLPRDVKIQRMALAGMEIPEDLLIIRFLPNGSSDSAELLLQSESGSTLRIIADPITGGARIRSGSRDDLP